MPISALEVVFANAALPQKVVLIVLVAVIPMILAAASLVLRSGFGACLGRHFIADVRVAAPVLGLFVGGLSSFHMGETIQRLPFDPTLKQLAPGIFEVSTLVSLGAFVGLVAVVAHAAIRRISAQERTL